MKKQHLAILSATFLLVIALITQNVFATSVDSSAGTSPTSSKYVDVTGNSLSTNEASKVQSLLSSIKKTEGFVVYANNIDRTNHIEGNICVNSVTTSTNLVITRVGEKKDGDFSYVGSSTSSIQLSDNEKIIVGPEISVTKPNSNQTIINGGYSNNIVVEQLSAEENLAKSTEVSTVLSELSQAGKSLAKNVDTSFYGSSKNSFESVNSMLESKALNTGDVVVINVDYKHLLNNEGAFGNLINNNSGTRVVVNVIFSDSGVTDINILKCFTANTKVSTDFNALSSYIIWNFGDYSGNITVSEEMCGVIVAPNATVYQAAGNLNGQIISNVAGNNGELHQVTSTPSVPSIPEEPGEPEKPTEEPEEPTEKPEEPTEEPEKPTEEPEQPTEEPEEPTEPDEPDEPEEPKTPDKPTVPEAPTEPEVPDTPNEPIVPEQPVIPDTPTTVTTPQIPDTPTTVDTPTPTTPTTPSENVEIPISPKTGDDTFIFVDALGVFAGFAIIIVIILHIKKKKK